MKSVLKLLSAVICCEAIGFIGTLFTLSAIPTWYVYLQKPFFSPPNWIFAPAWTVLYLLMGIAVFLIWQKGLKKKKVKKTIAIFLVQLLLNFLWTPLFFGLHSPIFGLIDIILLLLSIIMTIRAFYPVSKNAAYLLIPYLVWVSFATLLNLSIVLLNYS